MENTLPKGDMVNTLRRCGVSADFRRIEGRHIVTLSSRHADDCDVTRAGATQLEALRAAYDEYARVGKAWYLSAAEQTD